MTRPKADTDGWLTDPISRDRTIAKSVVMGLRSIEVLLRGIRDDFDESRTLRAAMTEMLERSAYNEARTEALLTLIETSPTVPAGVRDRARALTRSKGHTFDFTPCEVNFCGLPSGHGDPHAPRLRR